MLSIQEKIARVNKLKEKPVKIVEQAKKEVELVILRRESIKVQ